MAKSQGKRKPRVTDALKLEVLEAYRKRGTRPVREILKQFRIVPSQLHRWNAQFPVARKSRAVLPPPPPEISRKHSGLIRAAGLNGKTRLAPNYSEIARLQRKNQTLSEEIEVLKKTIVVFARRG